MEVFCIGGGGDDGVERRVSRIIINMMLCVETAARSEEDVRARARERVRNMDFMDE